jgi:hypothetical protein
MIDVRNADSEQLRCFVYFVVLGATLYVSCMLISVELGGSLFSHLLTRSLLRRPASFQGESHKWSITAARRSYLGVCCVPN